LVGLAVDRVQVLWHRTIAVPSPEEFESRLAGQTVRDVGRRGKFLVLRLDRGWLLFHLRMSGDLFMEPAAAPLAPHHRLVIYFRNNWRLAFNDARKFGRVWLVEDLQQVLAGLGPEPLDPGFTAQDLYQRLQASRRPLKPLLLDQAFLAGIGNIYADEALHRAGLHPLLPSWQVTPEGAGRLWRSIRETLEEGIRRHGASIDWVYRGGDFQNVFRVYQRTGEPCPVCGTPVQRMVVGQRGTHFCPSCQPPGPVS
jgi:formamidopyrimidine-DNA glycosylase